MGLEGVVDIGGHRPEILADQSGLVTAGLETQDGGDVVGRVMHIDPLGGRCPRGNPEQSMQAHDVVDTQTARHLKMTCERGA